jgi:hypothetical protein
MGDCKKGSSNCFKCGKPGHFLKNCPMNPIEETRAQGIRSQQRNSARARVYSLVLNDTDKEEFANMEIHTI